MARRVLFISNGHGEDNHSAHIIRRLRAMAPRVEVAALPIVGQGNAYRALDVPVIGPVRDMPSGGFTYMNRWLLMGDLRAGLLGLTLGQLRALRRQAGGFDLVHATGDTVGQGFAWASGRPYVSFISCLSALYEGQLRIEPLLRLSLRSRRCLAVVTRDPPTADDLRRQGYAHAVFGGIPSLDWLAPEGRALHLAEGLPVVALLPGSRLPEALANLRLMLDLVREVAALPGPAVQFRAALTGAVMREVPALARAAGWAWHDGWLTHPEAPDARLFCHDAAFADILHAARVVVGMAGLAVDQAVALGRPVIQIAGQGPQFTPAFAEAQQRLLGVSARTFADGPATPGTLRAAARLLRETLGDDAYLALCAREGPARLGRPGASHRIAQLILDKLDNPVRLGRPIA